MKGVRGRASHYACRHEGAPDVELRGVSTRMPRALRSTLRRGHCAPLAGHCRVRLGSPVRRAPHRGPPARTLRRSSGRRVCRRAGRALRRTAAPPIAISGRCSASRGSGPGTVGLICARCEPATQAIRRAVCASVRSSWRAPSLFAVMTRVVGFRNILVHHRTAPSASPALPRARPQSQARPSARSVRKRGRTVSSRAVSRSSSQWPPVWRTSGGAPS